MNNGHLTNDRLQLFVDGALPRSETKLIEQHLQVCAQCMRVHATLLRLDASLKEIPPQHPGVDFTRGVLEKLNIVPKSPILFRIVENLAYVFGMMMVLAIMMVVFVLTGGIDTSKVSQTQIMVRNTGEAFAEYGTALTHSLSMALQKYFPFLFGNGNLKIAVTGTLILGMLALLDRFVRRRALSDS